MVIATVGSMKVNTTLLLIARCPSLLHSSATVIKSSIRLYDWCRIKCFFKQLLFRSTYHQQNRKPAVHLSNNLKFPSEWPVRGWSLSTQVWPFAVFVVTQSEPRAWHLNPVRGTTQTQNTSNRRDRTPLILTASPHTQITSIYYDSFLCLSIEFPCCLCYNNSSETVSCNTTARPITYTRKKDKSFKVVSSIPF